MNEAVMCDVLTNSREVEKRVFFRKSGQRVMPKPADDDVPVCIKQVSEPPPPCQRNCFRSPWKDSDIVLIVGDVRFYAHKLVLSLNSRVFDIMLNSEFRERDATEIPLPNKKPAEVHDMLCLLYPEYLSHSVVTEHNLSDLLRVADEYDIPTIIDKCQDFLRIHLLSNKEDSQDILLLAQKYNMKRLKKDCYEQCKYITYQDLSKHPTFHSMDVESLNSILIPKLMNYERCLKELYPHLIGVLERSIAKNYREHVYRCKDHQDGDHGRPKCSMAKRLRCRTCITILRDFCEQMTTVTNKLDENWQTVKVKCYKDCSATPYYNGKEFVEVLIDVINLLDK